MIGIIARHQSLSLFRSAQTWVIAAILALLFGFLFLRQLENFIGVQDQLALQDYPVGLSGFLSVSYLQPLALAFSFVAPLFAMRTFSDEFRQHTYALWQSSPVSTRLAGAGQVHRAVSGSGHACIARRWHGADDASVRADRPARCGNVRSGFNAVQRCRCCLRHVFFIADPA